MRYYFLLLKKLAVLPGSHIFLTSCLRLYKPVSPCHVRNVKYLTLSRFYTHLLRPQVARGLEAPRVSILPPGSSDYSVDDGERAHFETTNSDANTAACNTTFSNLLNHTYLVTGYYLPQILLQVE